MGHGFGNYILSKNVNPEMNDYLGIGKDIRDYNAASLLLKEKLDSDNKNEIDLLYSCSYESE